MFRNAHFQDAIGSDSDSPNGSLEASLCAFILPELMDIPSKERCVASSAKSQHTCGLVLSELGQESGEQAFIPIIASHSGILS